MKQLLILFTVMLVGNQVFSQEIFGSVSEIDINKKQTPVPFASIYWAGTKIGTTADLNGAFKITYPDSMPGKLIASFVGMNPDTIVILKKEAAKVKFVLYSSMLMPDVIIIGKKQSDSYSMFTPINVQTITRHELLKGACCNLSESFETNASVDVSYTDAVSGAKQIQMLGLDGIYTQILSENIPLTRGLSSIYGLNYTPGTWVNNIYITKGTGSVVNGYESISGQIQIELLDPFNAEKLFANVYFNQHTRLEANLHLAKKIKNERVATMLFVHAAQMQMQQDDNNDNFIDDPLAKQINVLNKWEFNNGKNYEGKVGIKIMIEDKMSGQTSASHTHQAIDTTGYRIGTKTTMAELFSKNGFLFPSRPYKSIGVQTAFKYHKHDSYFGKQIYNGEQLYGFTNIIHEGIIGNTYHKLKTGASLMTDIFNQQFNDSAFVRTELVPGIFAEYSYNDTAKHSLVVGVRADNHNLFGFFFNPRIHYKYIIKEGVAVRLSAGKGMRVANIFTENMGVFASSRKLEVRENLLPENALNYGLSLITNFQLFNRDAAFNADYFRTDFINQVVVDLENPNVIAFYNLNGKSFSNAVQLDFSFSPLERFDIKTAYKYYDVKITYDSVLLAKPLLPNHRILVNLAYATPYNKWKFDFTFKWFSSTRLPSTKGNPQQFILSEYSNPYIIMNAQITKRFKWFETYLGVENLNNYVQQPAIIDYNNPFGNNFDASIIWSPINNRMFYLGIRYSLN